MPEKVLGDTARWARLHPDFSHKIWSLDDVLRTAEQSRFAGFSGDELVELIEVCRFPAMKADLGRLVVLHVHGGFWVDLKLVPKRTFLPELLGHDLVLTEHQPTPQVPDTARAGLLNNCFFACQPGSAFVAEVAKFAFSNVRERKHGVWQVTGPKAYMEVTAKRFPDAFSKPHPGLRLLRAGEFYEVLVGFGYGSYNSGGMHWSQRLQHEPVYHGNAPVAEHVAG